MFTSNMMKMILKNRCKKRHLGGVEWFELNAAETEINYRRNYQESNLHPTSSTQAYKHFINPSTSISSSNSHNYFSNLSSSISSSQSYKNVVNPILQIFQQVFYQLNHTSFLSTQSNKYQSDVQYSVFSLKAHCKIYNKLI